MFRLVKPYLRIGARSWGASSQYAFSMSDFFKEAQLASSQYAFSMEVIFFKEATGQLKGLAGRGRDSLTVIREDRFE